MDSYDQATAPTEPEEKTGELSDDELVERAKECYRLGIDATAEWRACAIEDLEFLAGEQWDANLKGMRDAQGRPALTVNRLPQFVRQITNEQRQNKPAITVSPVDDGGDKQTAEVLQGIIRNIEYTSNADAAYAAGGFSAVVTGLGYWDVVAEYEDENSFEQRITIQRIPNPLSVVMDPGAKEVAGDDARWVIKSTDLSQSEWKAAYPGKEMPKGSGGGWEGDGDAAADWVAKDGVRLHEYRYITEEPDELIEIPAGIYDDMPDGGAALASEIDPNEAAFLKASKVHTRKTTKRKACWAKIAGDEVVERGELAGKYLQLVRVLGTEIVIGKRTIYEGVIKHAKDPQKILNFDASAEIEAIALTPKAPWLMAEGQDEGHETDWETANTRAHSRLIYKPIAVGGTVAPPPMRVMSEANIQAITTSRMQAADDLKAVTGIYDGQLGARSNETSGKAILARESQGQTSNYHYLDHQGMSIRYTGRICVDIIPRIYSDARMMRILGADDEHEMVPVNQPGEFRGEQVHIQLDAGRYDVAVSMGPSYQSRRQEVAAQLLELIKVNPTISQIAGDILVQSMDIPGADAIAERIRKVLPPEVRPPDDKAPPPQVLAQQVQMLSQQHDMLVQQLHAAKDALENNAQDNASKERIALINAQVELVKTAAQIQSQEAQAMLDHTSKVIQARMKIDGMNAAPEATQTP